MFQSKQLTFLQHFLSFRFLWPCIVSKVWRERKPKNATIRCLLSISVSTCFWHHYAHLQENKDHVTAYGVLFWFCWMWLVAFVGRCVVGCEHCAHILQRSAPQPLPTTSSRTRAVHRSSEDGHNDAWNMLRQKLIINIWLLHLVGFLSLHTSTALNV